MPQSKTNKLTAFEKHVIEDKGTEPPFSGLYTLTDAPGVYTCKRCDAPLYKSEDKFPSHCGWPSFDDEIPGAIERRTDADGQRIEILCMKCGGHLGHVFEGEGFTRKNIRHCVNSVSMNFRARSSTARETAVLASGCFWGTQHYLARLPGIIETTVGYCGGSVEHPTYEQVCGKKTGHLEVVEAIFDPTKTSYEAILKLYFETHDFTQRDGQGPDIGPQYLSAIFYQNDEQKKIAAAMIEELRSMGYDVATELRPANKFWPAEDYHQKYYERKGDTPYCHIYRKIFTD